MKKLLFLSGLVAICWNCSNEFEINAPRKDIPVVYSLIDFEEANHYVRLERAFLDSELSALELAQIPDSLYYDDAEVTIEVGGILRTLDRIDATTIGLPRNTGIFADQPNIVYRMIGGFQGNEQARLNITFADGKEPITASTTILGDIELRSPSSQAQFSIRPDRPVTLRWAHDAQDEPRVYKIDLLFQYQELDAETNQFVDQELRIDLGTVQDDQTMMFDGQRFYEALGAGIDAEVQTTRLIGELWVEIAAAGQEVIAGTRIENANSGITSSQEIPTFSNLSRGIGIFSSRKTVVEGRILTAQTRDSIRQNSFTKDLGFL